MPKNKLAVDLYKLAWSIEHATRTATKYIKYKDPQGYTVMVPADLGVDWLYSPYNQQKSTQVGTFALKTLKEARVAAYMVKFRDSCGRTFLLAESDVGDAAWVTSPWDRTRAQREELFQAVFQATA